MQHCRPTTIQISCVPGCRPVTIQISATIQISCVSGFVTRDRREWESQQWSSGFVKKTSLRCNHAGNLTASDGFMEFSGKSIAPQGVPYEGQGQCSAACLSNCFRTVSFTVGCVNMVCSIFWVVFIAFDGGADSSSPPSWRCWSSKGVGFPTSYPIQYF